MQSPLKEPPLRLPGQSTEKRLYDVLLDKIMLFGVLIAVSVGMIASEWLRFFLNTQPNPTLVTFLLSGLIVFSMLMIIKNYKYVRQLKQGRDGERVVGQLLEYLRTDGAEIFHDVVNDNGGIDHIIVSPKGIFTVETKTWSKRSPDEHITYDGNSLFVNGFSTDHDPIRQSKAESYWLKSFLEKHTGKIFDVRPMVLFPGWFVESASTKTLLREQGVLLLSANAVIGYLGAFDDVVSGEDIQLVSNHLSQYVKTTKPS